MANIMLMELAGEELTSVGALAQGMSDDQVSTFAQRKDPNTVANYPGFIIVAGVQRFYVGQIGMGLLFLFTGGFCLIGTIIDVINHKKLATEPSELAMRVKG